jgi:hypothetical protein
MPGLMTFFSKTGPRVGQASLRLWSQVAPIVADYPDLRDEHLDDGSRTELFRDFADSLNRAGLYAGGWAPVFPDDDEDDEPDGDW